MKDKFLDAGIKGRKILGAGKKFLKKFLQVIRLLEQ